MSSELAGLAGRLQRLREMAPNLSARELDRLAGVARGYASLIEGRERLNVSAAVIAGYARVLGTTTDHLILGAGEPPNADDITAAVEAARADWRSKNPSPRTGTEG